MSLVQKVPNTHRHFLSQHPKTNQWVCLQGAWVGYWLKRSQRKSVGFMITRQGLGVTAPARLSQNKLSEALQEKAAWILRKLDEQKTLQQALQAVHIHWHDHQYTIPYLGQAVRLPLELPIHASPTQRRKAAYAWFQQQAMRVFSERLNWYGRLLEVHYRRLKISNAGTRWGSASSDGTIRLSWRLLHFNLALIDYVVVHELSHLRYMDHSTHFWATVHSVMPDYQKRRKDLRQSLSPVWEDAQ